MSQKATTHLSNAFRLGVFLNLGFVIVEAIFGYLHNSTALVSDALHNLSDVLGLVISWVALFLSSRLPTAQRTYGYKSSSILAALINAIFLLVSVGVIIYEAVLRLIHPVPSDGPVVITVALIGIVINGLTAMMFLRDQKKDLNIRSAFLHMAADTAISMGVVIAGVIITFTNWTFVDPLVAIAIGIIVLTGTWSLLKESVRMAMNEVPENVDIKAVQQCIENEPTVEKVHDLHVWPISTHETALTVHLVRNTDQDNDQFITKLSKDLKEHYHISHITIQIEYGDFQGLEAVENTY